jgi:hypothetical protein
MKNHKCLFCEDTYTDQDLVELKEMGTLEGGAGDARD